MTKLTKELIDKVRHIEGFPIGEDEDIIALSDPPHYTACPNPFIEDFIKEHGKPYDEETDDYHREPFASDVSEGKNDPIYNAHSYHTKVPHKAIMRYILHYTEPGDIVFDGFCGTGMTGVAAQMCGTPDPEFKYQIEQEMPYVKWGARKAILNDLSPAATFIAANYNSPMDVAEFEREATKILKECEKECAWMFATQHVDDTGQVILGVDGKPVTGRVKYVVWSDVFICPNCSMEFVFWDVAVNKMTGKVCSLFDCPHCSTELKKRDCERATQIEFDAALNINSTLSMQVPVLINYTVGKKQYEKKPSSYDLNIISKIADIDIPYHYPVRKLPSGDKTSDPKSLGINYVHYFYTKRNLYILSNLRSKAKSNSIIFWLNSIDHGVSKRVKHGNWSFPMSVLSGTLYIPSLSRENNPLYFYNNKLKKQVKMFQRIASKKSHNIISTQSLTDLTNVTSNCVDYIFTDPPFGSNLMYSELNFLWESWMKLFTNNKEEAIVNKAQKKDFNKYQNLMTESFLECCRILKPNRWITVEFHNSANAVWNSIQEALLQVGFVVADVRVLNKEQGSFNQVNAYGAVKKDLIISAYKPKDSFKQRFLESAGSEKAVWEFVRQHLEKLPVVVENSDKLDIISERQAFLLYDRMVAYHVVNGITVPMDAGDFYKGLKVKFIERDGMYFLSDQVHEYDSKRMSLDFNSQLSLFVSDEKSAIQWLYQELLTPQIYQELQPKFMREANFVRHEQKLELTEILDQNFLQDDKGCWYVPDPNKQSDLEKLREKALLREFDEYKDGKGMLKVFRTEAVRAGFKACWQNRDYTTIVKIADRIPEKVLQEDQTMLMFYNNALTRVEK